MNPVAIYYNNTNIYFSTLIVAGAIIAALFVGLSLYVPTHKNPLPLILYTILAVPASMFFSRIIYWYCNMESFDSFKSAITNYNSGEYCISGLLLGIWLPAMILQLTKAVKSRFEILGAMAPGFAFVIAMIRFSHYFYNTCRGKLMIDADGNEKYQFTPYLISFVVMLVVAIIAFIFSSNSEHCYKLFLILFCAEEIFIDSTRSDASHLFFSGEALANLNKGASFMGLSQFISALILAYVWARSLRKKQPAKIILFLAGLIIAGGCEYLVQRFTSMYLPIYGGQLLGLALMITGILLYSNLTASSSTGAKLASTNPKSISL